MNIRAEQAFGKGYIAKAKNPSDFIEFVSNNLEQELATKLVNELGDHKLHVVQLSEPEFIEDLPEMWNSAVRQDLELKNLVQCKDCRMAYPWCKYFRFMLAGKGFCPFGEEQLKNGEREGE